MMSNHLHRRGSLLPGLWVLPAVLFLTVVSMPAADGTACDCTTQSRGDLNADGWLDSTDALLLAHFAAGNISVGDYGLGMEGCADLNLDCKVDIQDLMIYEGFLNDKVTGSHAGRYITYEGSKTCLPCHAQEVADVHSSIHYQWGGSTPDWVGMESAHGGKMGSINDFCTYPDFNWLGKLTNYDGNLVDSGCARCHVGLGLKPSAAATQAQLENIDCLVCHSDGYKRRVDQRAGVYKLVPDNAKMAVNILQAISDIKAPGRDACLNCHSRSGGGNNFKRGDLEEAHRNPSRDFDVHMASVANGGAGLVCIDCHQTSNHKISGRGSDLRPRETDFVPTCSMCHTAMPHSSSRLNKHTARVNCTVCHIPEFAKVAPTDMHRDFSQPGELDAATRLYEPHMLKAAHVQPDYAFFDGGSYFNVFGETSVPGDNGRVLMSAPAGDINTPGAKINAFKYHTATMAVDSAANRLIPLKMGILFSTGDSQNAIIQGANAIGWGYTGHQYVETERYMGLFHEVAPKEQALQCASCHDGGTRLDFDGLGYARRATRNGKPLCASCHGDKSGEWSPSELFTRVHSKHVDSKHIDCINCHYFASAY